MDYLLDYINFAGTFAFAISGALAAMNKKFDPFGVLIMAFVTSVGGGTIRDMLIGDRTAFWLIEPEYAIFILAGALFAILFRRKLAYLRKTIMLFDSAGLGLFTIVGVEIAIQSNLNAFACISLGTITGVFGGVIRDIFANEVPVIFRKEIYATISLFGGTIYYLLRELHIDFLVIQLIPIVIIVLLRILVVYYGWSFPQLKFAEDKS